MLPATRKCRSLKTTPMPTINVELKFSFQGKDGITSSLVYGRNIKVLLIHLFITVVNLQCMYNLNFSLLIASSLGIEEVDDICNF